MSAVVVDFASVLARRVSRSRSCQDARAYARGALKHDFTFWRGATGTRYVHTIYSLLECPELPNANLVLARRHASGRVEIARVCRVEHDAMSLNLAEVRRLAAQLGANEVHVHLLARNKSERAAIEHDISECGAIAVGAMH